MEEYAGGGMSLSQTRDISHNSEDEEDEQSPQSMPLLRGGSGGGRGGMSTRSRIIRNNSNCKSGGGGCGSGEVGEIARKPRGRPPGSKNKPKPPIVITRDNETALKPVVLEICTGSDVVEQVVEYARRRHVGLSVLSGCGTVSSVTLRHPMAHAPTISLHGPLNIVCLSGTYLGPTATSSVPHSSSSSFSLSLAGSQGQVFGGIIAGKVTAQTPVVVVAATFASPSYQRLPAGVGDGEEGEEANNNNNNKNTTGGGGGMSESGVSSGSGTGMVAAPPGIYNNVGGGQAQTGGGLNAPDVLHWGSAPVVARPHPY